MIRSASIDDIEELFKLDQASREDFWSFSLWESELNALNSVIRVFSNNSRILAALCSRMVDAESELFLVICHPDARRQGFANLLLQDWIFLCENHKIEFLFLEVSHLNVGAIELYVKNGFKKTGLRKNYYKTEEHAVLKSRSLI